MGRTVPPVLLRSLQIAMAFFCLVSPHLISTDSLVRAQDYHAEYTLKAAFLYNFTKFVEWPEAAGPKGTDPFTLCLVGDAFGSSIDSLEGKAVRGHPLAIRKNPPTSAFKNCHLLFVSTEDIPRFITTLAGLQTSPVLTVCDSPGCAEHGLMINIRMSDNRVSIEVNLEAIQHTPLKVSSQLLKLARIVKNERGNP